MHMLLYEYARYLLCSKLYTHEPQQPASQSWTAAAALRMFKRVPAGGDCVLRTYGSVLLRYVVLFFALITCSLMWTSHGFCENLPPLLLLPCINAYINTTTNITTTKHHYESSPPPQQCLRWINYGRNCAARCFCFNMEIYDHFLGLMNSL